MHKNNKIFLIFFLFTCFISCPKYESSAPYISGDTFRAICDYKIDEEGLYFDPIKVKTGDIIYVHPHFLKIFVTKLRPFILHRYILVTHNCDLSMPWKFGALLNDPKLIVWFAENAVIKHSKLIGLPLGIMNETLCSWAQKVIGKKSGYKSILEKFINQIKTKPVAKDILLYMNFSVTSNRVRNHVYNLFRKKSYCVEETRKPLDKYLADFARSKFILSPAGVGLDCIRTWEALYMGCYPIVQSSPLDYLYTDLPVVIVKKWEDITREFLEQKYIELSQKKYKLEKLYAQYWIDIIKKYQEDARG